MSLCGTNDDDEQLKIELLSQWKLEAEFRNCPLKIMMKSSKITPTNDKYLMHCLLWWLVVGEFESTSKLIGPGDKSDSSFLFNLH